MKKASPEVVKEIGMLSKNPLLESRSTGDESGDVAGVSRKLRDVEELSESCAESIDAFEEAVSVAISGAFKACTLVVEMSSVGSEIRLR